MNKRLVVNILKINFIGDISFNDNFKQIVRQKINPFKELSPDLFKADMVVGNLESISSGTEGVNPKKIPTISTDIKSLEYLKLLNIKLLTLAHNHTYDNLESGYSSTVHFLEKNKICYIGTGFSSEEAKKPHIIKKNNITICFLNYVSEDTNPNLPSDATVFVNIFEDNKIINDIELYRSEVDFIVLLLHWGGKVDYGHYPHLDQVKSAKKFIDAGADLIVGHHTHSLQASEKYKGKHIYYNLGNFYFSDVKYGDKYYEVDRQSGTKSLILQVQFTKSQYEVDLIPIRNHFNTMAIEESILKELKWTNIKFFFMKKVKPLFWIYYFQNKYVRPIRFYFFGNNRSFWTQVKTLKLDKILNYLKVPRTS